MLCPGLLRWALLLALGLCRAHRARSRNVLLILGESAPADALLRGALPFTATCCRPQRRLLASPQHRSMLTPGFPEAPLLSPPRLPSLLSPESSWAAPWRGRQGGPKIQHPAPAAGSDPASPSVPRAPDNHVGPQLGRLDTFQSSGVHRSQRGCQKRGRLAPKSPEASQSALGLSSPL